MLYDVFCMFLAGLALLTLCVAAIIVAATIIRIKNHSAEKCANLDCDSPALRNHGLCSDCLCDGYESDNYHEQFNSYGE